MSAWLKGLADDLADLADEARRSLVTVVGDGVGVGAGVLWAPGWVVTNAHVARSPRNQVRLPDGRPIEVRQRIRDPRLDLAVLAIDSDAGAPARIGDSGALRAGEWVLAVGNPLGVHGGLTAGIVIDPAAGRNGGLLALDLHLRPGHSGGAVLNARGEVVGINTMMNGPDVGVAISSATVGRFLARSGLGKVSSSARRAA